MPPKGAGGSVVELEPESQLFASAEHGFRFGSDRNRKNKSKKVKTNFPTFWKNNAATNCKKILTFFLTAGSFSEFESKGRYEVRTRTTINYYGSTTLAGLQGGL
jgi:hypothetical protein